MSDAGHRHRHSETYTDTYARRRQCQRELAANSPSERATWNRFTLGNLWSLPDKLYGQLAWPGMRRRRPRRHVWCWQKFSHFARMLARNENCRVGQSAAGTESENSNKCRERERERERNWKRACSMRHFSLKVSLFVVPQTSILISRQKLSR